MLSFWVGEWADHGAKARIDEMYAFPETKAAHPDYYSFRNELRQMGGYPKRLKKIAISNGNVDGTTWHHVSRYPGSEILDFKIKVAAWPNDDTIFHTVLYDDPWTSTGTLITQSFFGDTDRVQNVRLTGGKRNYGASPGSYSTMMNELNHKLEIRDDIGIPLGAEIQYSTGLFSEGNGNRDRTFIPTVSALDLQTTNLFYTANDFTTSPFDEVYTNNTEENLEHGQISGFLQTVIEDELNDPTSRNWFEARIMTAIL